MMRQHLFYFVILWTVTVGPALAQEPHQHWRPDDIQQYLEPLDRTGRNQYQEPLQVIDALESKPAIAVGDLASGAIPRRPGPADHYFGMTKNHAILVF